MAPTRRVTEGIHQSYLSKVFISQVHQGRYVALCRRLYGYGVIRYVQYMLSGMALRAKVEYIRFRTGDRVGEHMLILIILFQAGERVICSHVVGRTNQRNLEFRVIYRLKATPVAFESVYRCTRLQRELHMQRIDDIDVLTVYGHVRWTGRRAGGGDRCSESIGGEGITQSAHRIRTAVKITGIRDALDGITRLPF